MIANPAPDHVFTAFLWYSLSLNDSPCPCKPTLVGYFQGYETGGSKVRENTVLKALSGILTSADHTFHLKSSIHN